MLCVTERGYSDEEEEGEFSSVDEADDMTYGGAAGRRAHRQLAFKQGDLSYTKVLLFTVRNLRLDYTGDRSLHKHMIGYLTYIFVGIIYFIFYIK